MRPDYLNSKILLLTAWLSALILVLMPFHAFLTVWGSSIVGHYTLLRLWKELLLFIILGLVIYLFASSKDKLYKELDGRIFWLIVAYCFLNLVWGIVAYSKHGVNLKALSYALVINLRFLGFFLATWIISKKSDFLKRNWQKIILWPASVVVVFGLLQSFVLPYDFLRHFGYNMNLNIPAFETINNNTHYVRIISTLRGANPLGAYLAIPLSALFVLTLRGYRDWKKVLLIISLIIVLFFSYSRSAWIGALITILVVLAISRLSLISSRKILYSVSIGLVLIMGLAFSFRNNTRLENLILHTQSNSSVSTTSNAGHASALKTGLTDVVHQPLGRGPGSAGPASVYNNHPARVAENYYIQIGQELGWLGLIILLLINARLAYLLWLQRHDVLALSLFASLVGISFINLLSHAWTDDTLAYVWWGLAGIAMANGTVKAENVKSKNR